MRESFSDNERNVAEAQLSSENNPSCLSDICFIALGIENLFA